MNDKELLWKQYNLNIDLYRTYLELTLKMNVFYYAITGAILSYYFTHTGEELVKLSLLLPLMMSVAFGIFFLIGAVLAIVTRKETFAIRDKLDLMAAPDMIILIILLCIFSLLMFLTAVGLGYLLSLEI